MSICTGVIAVEVADINKKEKIKLTNEPKSRYDPYILRTRNSILLELSRFVFVLENVVRDIPVTKKKRIKPVPSGL